MKGEERGREDEHDSGDPESMSEVTETTDRP